MKRLKNVWSDYPLVDFVVPVAIFAAVLVVALLVNGSSLVDQVGRRAIYTGTASVAALGFTASTFVCTMVYQSTNYLMSDIRKKHSVAVRRNWTTILATLPVAAVAAVVLHALDAWFSDLAIASAAGLLALVVALLIRAVWWLRRTLFIEDVASKRVGVEGLDARQLQRKF